MLNGFFFTTAVFWAVFFTQQSCDCNVKPLTGKQRRATLSAANERCCVREEQCKLLRAPERTDESPGNKQTTATTAKSTDSSAAQVRRLPPYRSPVRSQVVLCYSATCVRFGRAVKLSRREVKSNAFVTNPIPLSVSRSLPHPRIRVCVCGELAPRVRACPFPRASNSNRHRDPRLGQQPSDWPRSSSTLSVRKKSPSAFQLLFFFFISVFTLAACLPSSRSSPYSQY